MTGVRWSADHRLLSCSPAGCSSA